MKLAEEMFGLRHDLIEQGIIVCYSGFMTEDVLTGIGKSIRTKLEIDHAERRVAQGVFGIFVEQVQNVIRYSSERDVMDKPSGEGEVKDLRYGILTVGRLDESFFVSCGNLVENRDVERLRDALSEIQGLDKEGLKALYKETLRGETPEGSKGAGVGFIDIARRASHGFDFDFQSVDDKHSFFCLKAFV